MDRIVHYLVIQPGITGPEYDEPGAITLHQTSSERLGDKIREHVGGYFDVAAGLHDAAIFVHDEGLLIGLKSNVLASTLSRYAQHLVGPAVIAGPPDEDGDTTSVPVAIVEMIARQFAIVEAPIDAR